MKQADIQVTYINHCGDDLSIVNAARVSFHKEAQWGVEYNNSNFGILEDKDVKLINYLAKHKHFSPFNHAFLSFRVKAPIFVSRQLVKHRFMPWNEVSRRYVDDEPEFYFPDLRKRADNVKQGSSEEQVEDYEAWVKIVKEKCEFDTDVYESMIRGGVAPEVARAFLPQNMMTEWWWSGSLGAWLDMLVLRLDPHTQLESRIVAQLVAKKVEELFPVSYAARINQ